MKLLAIIVCIIAAWLKPVGATDDWIGLDKQPLLLGFDLGQDEVGDNSGALFVSLPLGHKAGYDGYYSLSRLTDGQQQFDSLALASSVWFQLTELVDLEVQHFFEGNGGELEKETLGLALGLSDGDWHFRLHYDDGNLFIYTRDDVSDFINSLVPDRIESDVSGYGLALGWQGDAWYWQARFRETDYAQDLRPLGQSRFVQFVIKSAALAQSSLLNSQNASLLVGRADLDNDYSVALTQDQSAIDRSHDEYLILSWQHWARQDIGYLLAASLPLPADDIGLTLGLRWVL